MHQRERQRVIVSTVNDRQFVSVADLAEITEASLATIRRDISELSLSGAIKHVHGGAEAKHSAGLGKIAADRFSANSHRMSDQKRAIARAAAEMCKEGGTVVINGGSTTFHMAHWLVSKRLHVLTNSVPLSNELLNRTQCVVSMPGGSVYREQQVIMSPLVEDGTQNFVAETLFTSCYALGPRGLLEKDQLLIHAELKLLSIAQQVVALVDSSKFRRSAHFVLTPLRRISTVITDDGARDEDIQLLEDAGTRCVIASVKSEYSSKKSNNNSTSVGV